MYCLDNFIFLDIETTGLDKKSDEIIEIGAIKVKNGKEVAVFHRLVNPKRKYISPFIFKLCQGLKEEELRASPSFEAIKDELLEFIGDLPIVCHNATFDISFIETSLGCKLQNAILDSLELYCLFKPALASHKISSILEYLGKDHREKHRALDDARDCLQIVEVLFRDLQKDDSDLLENALKIMKGSSWGWLPYLEKIPFSLRRVSVSKPAKVKPMKRIRLSVDDAGKILGEMRLWEKQFPGYQLRKHQKEMVQELAIALKEKTALLVEAPTGSGKTLAYLLTSLLWIAHNSEEQVFISTNTKNLQGQLHRDLPKVAAVLGLAESVLFADMKGINNYACLNKINEEIKSGTEQDLGERLARLYLHNWSKRASGELEETSYWMRQNYPALKRLVYEVSCSREDCLEKDCKYKDACFYLNKLAAMKDSHICTINHSLLLKWPHGYPVIENLVIDEAHNIEKAAYDKFSEKVSLYDVNLFLKRLVRDSEGGFLKNLNRYYRRYFMSSDLKSLFDTFDRIEEQLGQITYELESLSSTAQLNPGYGFHQAVSLADNWSDLKFAVTMCAETFLSLAQRIDDVLELILDKDDSFLDRSLYSQGKRYVGVCKNWAEVLFDCFNQKRDDCCYHVKYMDRDKEKGGSVNWKFIITPLDVSRLFYEKVIDGTDSIVLTSATLAEDNNYDRIIKNLGFDLLKSEVRCLGPLEQVFDYKKNCVLAVPTDSPGYRNEDEFATFMADAVIKISQMLSGKTLVLFTSIKRRNAVYEAVIASLERAGVRALRGSSQGLVEQFREGDVVLFGSRGFSEGIDVKGSALSCVIIDKLSFPYQKEPVTAARRKRAADGFREIVLPEAILTLRQQFGRLLRHENDKGFVVVMDQLYPEKGYHVDVRRNLPGVPLIQKPLDELLDDMRDRYHRWGVL